MNNGKICVSVCAQTAAEFLEKINRAVKIADVVELRFDCLKTDELEQAQNAFHQRSDSLDYPFLITFRAPEQSGNRELDAEERLKFWNSGFDGFWAADFEEDVIDNSWYWLWQNRICSFHDFSGSAGNVSEIYQRLKLTQADILKIAVRVNDAADGLELMKLLERAAAEDKKLIPIAMGEAGIWTRILGLSRGAFMTFASLDEKDATAPGQLTAAEMLEVYRVKDLDAETEIYGLIGGSVTQSVSPQMHNAAFQFHHLNAVFLPLAVQNLDEFMRRMVKPETREIEWKLRGFSVTIPHKIEIIKYLDEVDETAAKIGAVNTVKITDDGKLHGFNTDAAGFIEPLKNSFGNLQNVSVAVLGAGGAARAAIYSLQNANANVTIFARDTAKAAKLAREFGVDLRQLNADSNFAAFQIVVNATPLGMKKGAFENETPALAAQIAGVGLVYDLIYNPFQTNLMREADKIFVPTLGGLAMLVAQGMRQQKIWTGKDAPMKEMSQAALRKLQD